VNNIIEIMPDNMPRWMQEAMESGRLAKVCMEKNEAKKDYIIEQSKIIKKLRREKTELAKSRFELNERLLARIEELKGHESRAEAIEAKLNEATNELRFLMRALDLCQVD
jgi:Ni,Fe-hydrogenase I large subunit